MELRSILLALCLFFIVSLASPVETDIKGSLDTLTSINNNGLLTTDSFVAAECVPKHGRCSKHEQCCSKRCAVSRLWPGFCWDDDMAADANEVQAREEDNGGHCFAEGNKCYAQDDLCCSGSCQCPDESIFKCTCGEAKLVAAGSSTADALKSEKRLAKDLFEDLVAARQVDTYDDRSHYFRYGAYFGDDDRKDACCSKNCVFQPGIECFCAEGYPPFADARDLASSEHDERDTASLKTANINLEEISAAAADIAKGGKPKPKPKPKPQPKPHECFEDGSSCKSDTDCCSSKCRDDHCTPSDLLTRGVPMPMSCKALHARCADDQDCCSDDCKSGKCGKRMLERSEEVVDQLQGPVPPPCKLGGIACRTNRECCFGHCDAASHECEQPRNTPLLW